MVITSHPLWIKRYVTRCLEVYRAKGIIHANAFKRRYVPAAMMEQVTSIFENVVKFGPPPAPRKA